MKKGITLIELLAVIIILAIIGSISFITIGNIVKNSKINLYNENITKIKDTAEMYISNGNKGYIEEGQTVEITLDELIEDGYLKEVKSPFDKSKTCNGYVLVSKLENNEYLYNPHINCEEDINNSTEDGLVLHYTFDDFQEPTENYLAYASNLSASNWSTYGFGDSSLNTKITTSSEGFLNSNSINVSRLTAHDYMTAVTSYKSSAIIFLPGEKVTASAYIKAGSAGVVGKTLQIHLYGLKTGGGSFSLGADTTPLTSEWKRYEYTLTNTDAVNWTVHNIYFKLNCGTSLIAGENYYVSSPQIEKKGYSTQFVDGSRTGTVKDYSINNNNSNLSLTNTPKWIEDRYSFDGINDYFFTPYKPVRFEDYTFSFWLYRNVSHQLYKVILGAGQKIGFKLNDNNLVAVSWGEDYYLPFSLNLNEWYYITLVFDKTNSRVEIYINGLLVGKRPSLIHANWSLDKPIAVGMYGEYPNGEEYPNINLDDVRIYNRTLNAKEILQLYYSTK